MPSASWLPCSANSTPVISMCSRSITESQNEWDEITAPDGAWEYLAEQKRQGRLKLIGLTSHQRPLAARWAQTGKLDLLMIRYNAAHRGAERDVFPVAHKRRIPIVTFTGLRWKALLAHTPEDPPQFTPPSAVECYRFCLANPIVSVALAAPGNRSRSIRISRYWTTGVRRKMWCAKVCGPTASACGGQQANSGESDRRCALHLAAESKAIDRFKYFPAVIIVDAK